MEDRCTHCLYEELKQETKRQREYLRSLQDKCDSEEPINKKQLNKEIEQLLLPLLQDK
jgi:hypothetical protein